MPHTNKKRKKEKIIMKQSDAHCRIGDVVDALSYQIKIGWITEKEFEEIYKKVKRRIKND